MTNDIASECVARFSTEGRDFKIFNTGLGNREIKSRTIAKITRSIKRPPPLCRGFFFFFFFRKRDREITPFFRDNGTRDRGPVPRTLLPLSLMSI